MTANTNTNTSTASRTTRRAVTTAALLASLIGGGAIYPEVALPADLTIPPKRYAVRDYPLAFWTLDSVAKGA